ncbi:MFS transporter [Agromyces salentinus]|uniref:MFS transporter n=1 Tax=Agromyces salentinus TaxID=269421 RepID=A0ABN2MIZ8_9MICO
MTVIRRGRGALVLALGSASLAGGLFLPLSLVYFTVLTDIDLAPLGGLVALAGLVTLPLPVLAGWLVDRIGPRPVVVAAMLLQALGYLLCVFVREPVGVFAASAALACGSRLFWSSVFALVVEAAAAEGDPGPEEWFARVNVIRTVGIIAGGLIAGLVISTDRPGLLVGLATAAAVACAAAGLILRVGHARSAGRPAGWIPVASTGSRPGYRAVLSDARFLGFLALNSVFALSTLFAGLSFPTLVRSGLGAPGWLTSSLLVGNAVLVAALGAWGGRLATRNEPFSVLRAAAALWAAAYLAVALGAAGGLVLAILALVTAVVLLSGAEILHAPASTALVSAMADPRVRGRYLAVFQYSFVAAELIAPVLFAALFVVSEPLPFLIVAGANVVALAGLLALRAGRGHGNRPSTSKREETGRPLLR